MSDSTLIIQYLDETVIHWFVVDMAGKTQQQQIHTHLASIPENLRKLATIVLIPGQDVTTQQISLPKMRRSELKQAIPLALEDQIPGSMRNLFIAIGQRDDDNQLTLAVINKEKMQSWLDSLAEHHINPTTMLPDYLALEHKPNSWSVHTQEQVVLMRFDYAQGLAGDLDNLSSLLPLILRQQAEKLPEHITLLGEVENFPASLLAEKDIALKTKSASENVDFFDIRELLENPAINLMQDEFKPKRKTTKTRKLWITAGILFSAWIVFSFAANTAQYFIYKNRLNNLQLKINAIYQQHFPGLSTVEPRFELNRLLKNFQGADVASPFLRLLIKISPTLKANPQITLTHLDYNKQQMLLTVKSTQAANIYHLTQKLSRQGLPVKTHSLIHKKNEVIAKISITEKTP